MIELILSLDYEVNGNGTGDPATLMIEPTKRLLKTADQFDAKVTIFAEVAEIMAMREIEAYRHVVEKIEDQLKDAIRCGHDVQLHLHPQWINPVYENGEWLLDLGKVSIARLTYDEMSAFISKGKNYLENLLTEADPSYQCCAFRAGYWCMMPSYPILKVLKEHSILYDSSVFKWGREDGQYVSFDYSLAHSNMMPWYTDDHDINLDSHDHENIFEIPIYTEHVYITSMITPKRLLSRNRGKGTRKDLNPMENGHTKRSLDFLFRKHPKKFDFCKLNYTEMKGMIEHIIRKVGPNAVFPVCAIGHSKEYLSDNDLIRFLEYIDRRYHGMLKTATFRDMKR